MSYRPETPFDSIEGAHQYVELLLESLEEAKREIEADIEAARKNKVERREQALQLIFHKLDRLEFHITRSRRVLNDLRSLRRLLLQERQPLADVDATIARAAGAD